MSQAPSDFEDDASFSDLSTVLITNASRRRNGWWPSLAYVAEHPVVRESLVAAAANSPILQAFFAAQASAAPESMLAATSQGLATATETVETDGAETAATVTGTGETGGTVTTADETTTNNNGV